MDLFTPHPFTIDPSERLLVGVGWAIALRPGLEAQIRPKSGLALKKGITLLNSPGTIDSDYRGEVGVILYNTSEVIVSFEKGDKIAQMVVAPIYRVFESGVQIVDELPESDRGGGGFGSTGR